MSAAARMAALRERRRAGRRIVVLELEAADLERIGLAGTARATEIVDSVLDTIRAVAKDAPISAPGDPQHVESQPTAIPVGPPVPFARARPPQPPNFDPSSDFGEVRDGPRRLIVQGGNLFEADGTFVGST